MMRRRLQALALRLKSGRMHTLHPTPKLKFRWAKLILDRLSPDAVISEKLKVGVADHLRLKEEAASNADAESSLSGMQRHSSAPEYTNVNLPASFSRPIVPQSAVSKTRSFSTPDGAVNINAGVHADENAPRRSSLKNMIAPVTL